MTYKSYGTTTVLGKTVLYGWAHTGDRLVLRFGCKSVAPTTFNLYLGASLVHEDHYRDAGATKRAAGLTTLVDISAISIGQVPGAADFGVSIPPVTLPASMASGKWVLTGTLWNGNPAGGLNITPRIGEGLLDTTAGLQAVWGVIIVER